MSIVSSWRQLGSCREYKAVMLIIQIYTLRTKGHFMRRRLNR